MILHHKEAVDMLMNNIKPACLLLLALSVSACGGGGGGSGDGGSNSDGSGSNPAPVTRTYQLQLEAIELTRADSGETLNAEGLPLDGTEVSVDE